MQELIDFSVSPAWLDFYHLQGLTPRHTPNYGHGTDLPPLTALEADIAVLRRQVSRLTAKLVEVEGIARQHPRRQGRSAPATTPQPTPKRKPRTIET